MNRFALTASYPGFALDARAEWDVPCCALFGASGSGKSTILEALAGLRPEVGGEVLLAGRRVDGLPPRERRVGWVPQDAALFPHLSVRENLAFPPAAVPASVDEAVGVLELGELLDRPATALSGGERQRVAIARALAARPSVLLFDEPLAAIDRPLRARVLPFLEELPARTGLPVLLVTHDPLEVVTLAQHVLVLEAGQVIDAGAPRSVFASAQAFGALQALGAENRFRVEVVERGAGTLAVRTAGGRRLSMVRVDGFPEPERVAVRAEDVLLAADDPGLVSAQNVFRARVVALEPLGEQVLVEFVDGEERWCVKITPRACEALEIVPGRELVLLVKAHAILPADG